MNCLPLKDGGHFSQKNAQKLSFLPFLPFQTKNKIIYFFALLTVRSCPRLLGEHVQKVSETFTARIVRL
jgi:hypothetical protein